MKELPEVERAQEPEDLLRALLRAFRANPAPELVEPRARTATSSSR